MSKTSKLKLVTMTATVCGDHLHPDPASVRSTDIEVTDMGKPTGAGKQFGGYSRAYSASWDRMFGARKAEDLN